MSTRGCVAIGTKDDWQGVYNHFDSYPTSLGAEVYEHLRGKGVEGLKKFAEELLKYDDWRNYLAGGKCEYCGQTGFGQPHSISGQIFLAKDLPPKTEADKEVLKNLEETGFPDPLAKWHSHGDLSDHMTPKNCDPLFIEWVYVIEPENQKMYVFTHGRAEGEHENTSYDNKRKWTSPNYTHYFVCEIDLSVVAVEPNWEFMDATGQKISDEMYDKFEKKEGKHA